MTEDVIRYIFINKKNINLKKYDYHLEKIIFTCWIHLFTYLKKLNYTDYL